TDPEKRKKYDQYGEHWKHGEQFEQQQQQGWESAGRSWEGYSGSFDEGRFSDFFESLFGHASGGSRQRFRGQDIQAELNLSLRDALHTHKHAFSVNGR